MAAETKKEIGLEIGHVLFIDIVGYSKLLIDEQRDYLQPPTTGPVEVDLLPLGIAKRVELE
jgi:hypothetical protein